MLIELTSEQVSRDWPVIRFSIEKAMPVTAGPLSKTEYLNLLTQLLNGNMKCLVLAHRNTATKKVEIFGVVVCSVSVEPATTARFLHIYSFASLVDSIPVSAWKTNFQQLKEYARANACEWIEAISENTGLVHLAASLGANTAAKYVRFGMEEA